MMRMRQDGHTEVSMVNLYLHMYIHTYIDMGGKMYVSNYQLWLRGVSSHFYPLSALFPSV